MDNNLVTAMELGAGSVAHSLSPWQLFLEADIIVKAVIILLVVASFWSWAIIFEKVMRYRRVMRQAAVFETMFWSGGSLQQLYESIQQQSMHPMSRLFESAMREWQRFSQDGSQQLEA
ncbi:MAG: Tol-Pal system subunit TolQ, partial [Pseudomonadota bacterium]|nr:Tol-Pal system subunit TolQ [Pseudomonadota bacterium]